MPSYLSPVFESLAERCLKRSVAALRDAGVPFCVIGSLALWARGGPESAHDIDLGIRPQDVLAAGEALAAAGFEVEIPPEDWLIKGWDHEGDGEPLLVDLIYQTSAFAIDDDVLARADDLDVLAVRMPVMSSADVLTSRLLSLTERHVDLAPLIAAARSVREQVDWDAVRERTGDSPFARAFLDIVDGLGITAPEGPDEPPGRWKTHAPECIDAAVEGRRLLAERLAQGSISAHTRAWSET